jgi:ubiquinone/menaquinone biosynthesis C-methylase UbiE
MKYEPSRLEILLTKIAFLFYGKSVYRAFANSLPLKGNDRVLDFGCGMGTVAHYTAKMLSRGHLTCLDISERWLNECRKNLRGYGNVTFVQTEFPALENESFDLVYCHFVLHDIWEGQLKKIIPALTESLKPGGMLIFREPLKETEKISLIKSLMEQNRLNRCSFQIVLG